VIPVIDTGTSQRNLNFQIPWDANYRTVYIKAGGDNVDTYEAPWYGKQEAAARPMGYRIGHYWVPDANPGDADLIDTAPEQAAYFVNLLRNWTARDFVVLDNENLDGGWRFGDAQTAEWIETVKALLAIPGRQVIVYTTLSDARAITWERTLATGAVFLVAAPSYPAGQWPDLPTIPRDRIVGHQYGVRDFGGVVTDVNVFTDDAFDFGGPVSYLNVDNWQVILVDGVRDADKSWAEHVARGSAGGVDCVALTPKPIHAPADGRIEFMFNNGSGGHTATLYQAGGWRDQFMHMSAFEGAGGRQVRQGDLIGYTGSTVAPGYAAVSPHLHWHRIDSSGVRRNPWHYFTGSSTAGGGGYTPIGDDIMALKGSLELINVAEENKWYLAGPFTWQELANQDGVDGGDKVRLFRDKLGIPVANLTTLEKNQLRIVLLGNQAAADNAKYAASLVKIPAATGGVDQVKLTADVVAGVLAGIPSGSQPFTKEELAKAVASELAARLTA